MEPVKRVVIRDKSPVFDADIFLRPLNRVVVGVVGVALLIQIVALGQVIAGQGKPAGWFDHASFAVVALLWLALGILVFLQRRAGDAGRLFLLSAAAGSAFLALATLYAQSYADALAYAAGLLFFPPFLYSFARAFSEKRPWRRAELLLYLPSAVLLLPGAQQLAEDRTVVSWKIALLLVAGYLIAAIVQALRDLRLGETPEEAAQTRALLFGLAAGTVPGLAAYIVPIVLNNSFTVNVKWLPPIVLLFLVAMSYAVLLFEFTEADLIVRRGIVYGVLALAIVIAYAVLGELLVASNLSVTSPGGGLSFVAVSVLIGAAFTPITYLARRLVDWLLYGRKTDRWTLLQALSARLSTVMQPDELGDALVQEITHALHLRGAFLLRRTEHGAFTLAHRAESASGRGRRTPPPVTLCLDAEILSAALGDPPRSLLLLHAKPLVRERRERVPERYEPLDQLHVALSIPLITRSGLEAVLCLQPKLAHGAFDADDLELLAPVTRQATAALDNALLFSRLAEKVEELRMAYVRIAREQESERGRLARELHDGTAQELAGLITLAAVAERQLGSDDHAAHNTLDRLKQQAEDAYQGVRRASHALRPLMLDDFGLAPTLGRYLQGWQEATGIEVEYGVDGVGELPDDVELALFRVAQECMENVRKHSGARHARLALQRENGHVLLSVSDSGSGMPEGGERGIGLVGMRERVEAVGGTIRVHTSAEDGVEVEAIIPVGGVP